MKKEFKVGDWIFCEFKLQQVKKVTNKEVTEVSDGMFCHSGKLTDRCFHLDMSVKRNSDLFSYWHKRFHDSGARLNYPDIQRKLVEDWVKMCEEEDNSVIAILAGELNDFGNTVMRSIDELKYSSVQGVNIFK